jgi:formylglycine-generating enzyme required for sulfatase activity
MPSCSGYRLPTEAEWEHAVRAGTESAVYAGDLPYCQDSSQNLDEIAWYKNNSYGHIHPVGEKVQNEWGLFDAIGNASEWTDDWYQESFEEAQGVDPTGPTAGTERVYRGGDYFHNADRCRAADRERFRPDKRFSFVGFRCVRTMPDEGRGS